MWLVINYCSQYFLYNIGRQQFVNVPVFDVVSMPCTFQDDPFPLEMTQQANGFTFRESGSDAEKGFMCAAPQNASKPVAQWTISAGGCQWLLVKVPDYNATDALEEVMRKLDTTGIKAIASGTTPRLEGIYTLSGQRMNQPPKHGIFILNGKKLIR